MTTSIELIEQRARVQAAIEEAAGHVAQLEALQAQLEIDLDEAIRASLRTGEAAAEEDIRRRLQEVDLHLDSGRRRHKLARSEHDRIARDLADAVAQERRALAKKGADLVAAIDARIMGDKKLRAALLESASLYVVANGPGVLDWAAYLEDILPHPTQDEWTAAEASAREALGLVAG